MIGNKARTRGLTHLRQVFYHHASPPAPQIEPRTQRSSSMQGQRPAAELRTRPQLPSLSFRLFEGSLRCDGLSSITNACCINLEEEAVFREEVWNAPCLLGISLLESSGPHLAPTDSAQPLHGSTEVSSSNAPCYLEPCSAFVMVPWPGFDRRKNFGAVFTGCRAVGGGGGLSCSLEPVLEGIG